MEDAPNFQFVLPLNSSDLINSCSDQYFVKEVFPSSELPGKLLGEFPLARRHI